MPRSAWTRESGVMYMDVRQKIALRQLLLRCSTTYFHVGVCLLRSRRHPAI